MWNLAAAALLIWRPSGVRLSGGRLCGYVMLYTSGRVWIELLRSTRSTTSVRSG